MLARIAAFEFRYQARGPLFIGTFAVLLLLAFGAVTSENVQLGALGSVNFNSPYALTQAVIVFTQIGMLVVAAFIATTITRDVELGSAEIFYATPVTKRAYLLGRFVGAYALSLLLLLAVPLGTMLGSVMPWLDPERVGPFELWYFLQPFLLFGATGMLFGGALAFGLAALTRSLAGTYVGIVALFLLVGISQNLVGDLDNRTWSALIDPFGGVTFQEVTRYWTAFERNRQTLPLTPLVLANRGLWLAIGLGILALAYARFRFELSPKRRQKTAKSRVDVEREPASSAPVTLPQASRQFTTATAWRQFMARTSLELRSVLKGAPFLILTALAVLATGFNLAFGLEQFFGTAVHPVTRVLTNVMSGSLTLSLLIVVIYHSAEIVWREREAGVNAVIDAAPLPGWTFAASKMLAMVLALAVLLLAGVLTGVVYQLSQGYTRIQPGVYLTRLMLDYGMLFYVSGIFAIFVQVLVRNKFIGMGIVLLVLILSLFVLEPLGFEDPLYRIGTHADIGYSDMNGWGYFGFIVGAYAAYWAFFCVLLFVAVHLLWPRGGTQALRLRLREARDALTPAMAGVGAAGLAGFLGVGGYIYYSTHVLNEYRTQDDIERHQIAYERRYMEHEDIAQPRIIGIEADLDLYPERRSYEATGTVTLANRTEMTIDTVYVGFHPSVSVREVTLRGMEPVQADPEHNYFTFELAEAMAPAARAKLRFDTAMIRRGFKHDRNAQGAFGGGAGTVVGNGSVVYGSGAMPYIGFSRNLIITDRNDRRKHELPEIERSPDLNDHAAARDSYLRQDSDWVEFKTTVSTAADQTAMAPGTPVREWTENGRRYTTYEMSAPIQNLVVYLSAEYARRSAQWNDVAIEIYYHASHDFNIDKMVETVKASLGYFSEHFSPYQYRQMRILELPAFLGSFAQSFANTIIWSEGLGFIARLDDPEDIDYVYYVGAHETAHQWWGHQVSSANVQGQTVLVETLAQYSALMVMEEKYGEHLMRRFLKHELDNYLSARGSEQREEKPLYRVENQPYIHYRKGSVAMYALKDYLGEARVNRALANLIDEAAYQYDPYPRSVDLLRHLDSVTETEAERRLIEDLFERIVLWDLEATSADVTRREDGRYDVTIEVSARKLKADGRGRESEVALDMPVDIGVFTRSPDAVDFDDEAVLHLAKHRVTSGKQTVELTVDRRPAYVGIDPYHKLIDRNTDDNLTDVQVAQ